MTPHWYCFLLDNQKTRGIGDLEKFLHREMVDIFGDDFCELKLIGQRVTDNNFEMQSESYFFVQCHDYQNHAHKVKNSSAISIVLPSVDAPIPVAIKDIENFASTTAQLNSIPGRVSVGDMVKVKAGHLKNLYGIVLSGCQRDGYMVLFRLYSCQLVEKLRHSNLVVQGSIFRYVRFPVISDEDGVVAEDILSEIVPLEVRCQICENTIHRKSHRASSSTEVPQKHACAFQS